MLNLERAFAAGLVWPVILILFGAFKAEHLALPLLLPSGVVFGLPLYIGVARLFVAFTGSAGELGVAVANAALSLGIAVGDPLVYVLHRKRPWMVPVESFKLFNLALVMFVLDPAQEAHEAVM